MLAVDPVTIMEDVTVPRRESDLTAWVNVIFGCNERCTYCVVPNTRGKEQSRAPEAIKVNPLPYKCSCSDGDQTAGNMSVLWMLSIAARTCGMAAQ